MSGKVTTANDVHAACKCGEKTACPGHYGMRESAYDAGYYRATDARPSQGKHFDLATKSRPEARK